MHVPDHLINNGTEIVAGASAVAVVGAAALQLRSGSTSTEQQPRTLLRNPERVGPQLATASLVFALQMVNFPVLPGTSGHLLGGALATALIGPRRALLAVASVVVAQSVFFADGGVGALGVNLWLIAILPVAIAAAVERLLRSRQERRRAPWWSVAGLAALAGPPVASLAFAALYATGAVGDAGLGEVTTSMLAVHLAIGVGEAVVTLTTLWVVERVGAADGIGDATPVWGAAALSAVGLSLLASSQPDGLERVAGDVGFAVTGEGSLLADSPLADYAVRGVEGGLSGSMAGLLGIVLTCAVGAALVALSRPARPVAAPAS
jgi:cobalt/nickel transport system permease protein